MASFSLTSTAHSVTVTIDSYDPAGSYTIFFRKASETTAEERNALSYTFSNLDSGTQYAANVREVLNGQTSFLGIQYIETNHAAPYVSSFSAVQTNKGEKTIDCSWTATDLEPGAQYSIQAYDSNGTLVALGASGPASNGYAYNVSLNNAWDKFRSYSVVLFIFNVPSDPFQYYASKTISVTMRSNEFAWTYPKIQGQAFNLTAQEWNDMWTAIEANRGSPYSHTIATQGANFTATMYNQAVNAIGAGTTVSKGNIITAALMNDLVTNINNMGS